MKDKIDEKKSNPRILLMDDEDIIRENMVELGEILNLDIVCARDGQETVELYKSAMVNSKKYSAVILDLTIKGNVGGDEVLKELKLIDPGVKAILFSGHSFSPATVNYKEYGFSAVIVKPIEASQLEKVVAEVIG